jgi:L-asparaginase/Glu-tRNA(Gln) amidotransferase subunit D
MSQNQTPSDKGVADVLSLGLILTGGTIGSAFSSDAVVRIPPGSKQLLLPETELIARSWGSARPLTVYQRQPLRGLSENFSPSDWASIARSIDDLYKSEDIDAFVVMHGTDTAAYTAAALSFALQHVGAPVVLTGSNLPPDQAGSDAETNLRDAMAAAAALGRGVYVSFAGAMHAPSWVHSGVCVRKIRASGQAFYSINRSPIARVEDASVELLSSDELPAQVYFESDSALSFNRQVLRITLYPGLDLSAIWIAVQESNCRGVVIELYASSTGPDVAGPASLPEFVSKCVERGLPVIGCLGTAPADPLNAYESSLAIRKAGATVINDMLPETATVKLMWILASTPGPDEVSALMSANYVGERTQGVEFDS